MAKKLIESMSVKWDPAIFKDDYHELLEKVVEEKIRAGGRTAPEPRVKRKASNVIDLVSVLKQSIQDAQGQPDSKAKSRKKEAA